MRVVTKIMNKFQMEPAMAAESAGIAEAKKDYGTRNADKYRSLLTMKAAPNRFGVVVLLLDKSGSMKQGVIDYVCNDGIMYIAKTLVKKGSTDGIAYYIHVIAFDSAAKTHHVLAPAEDYVKGMASLTPKGLTDYDQAVAFAMAQIDEDKAQIEKRHGKKPFVIMLTVGDGRQEKIVDGEHRFVPLEQKTKDLVRRGIKHNYNFIAVNIGTADKQTLLALAPESTVILQDGETPHDIAHAFEISEDDPTRLGELLCNLVCVKSSSSSMTVDGRYSSESINVRSEDDPIIENWDGDVYLLPSSVKEIHS